MKELGCICCRQLGIIAAGAEVHHLTLGGLAGQKRRGHDETVTLCAWHHRGVISSGETGRSMELRFGPSLARGSKEFRRTFGTDDQLLELQQHVLGRAW